MLNINPTVIIDWIDKQIPFAVGNFSLQSEWYNLSTISYRSQINRQISSVWLEGNNRFINIIRIK